MEVGNANIQESANEQKHPFLSSWVGFSLLILVDKSFGMLESMGEDSTWSIFEGLLTIVSVHILGQTPYQAASVVDFIFSFISVTILLIFHIYSNLHRNEENAVNYTKESSPSISKIDKIKINWYLIPAIFLLIPTTNTWMGFLVGGIIVFHSSRVTDRNGQWGIYLVIALLLLVRIDMSSSVILTTNLLIFFFLIRGLLKD
jgi:hypothetical protein